ncbi:hypothetical protein Pla163_17330 [Planctomycetes bacterium Pla163]|uniref:Uncharacterized protein n=1 Tax=Rohdeia mirabilis TaxID=2528008 RepID=A0A518CZJ5_9BACT|nr:hypothetical protein Pla163_17330 [Planctomycetes bacterium Pla163]
MQARTTSDARTGIARARDQHASATDVAGRANLLAVLGPGILFGIGLVLFTRAHGLDWLASPTHAPLELWLIAIFGTIASVCGVLDWRYHRAGHRIVPTLEQRAESFALVLGGAPLFVFMAVASVASTPRPWILAASAVSLYTAGAIVFDEVRFHRRCSSYETLLHRGLVGGNAIAYLAWLSWCLARSDGA